LIHPHAAPVPVRPGVRRRALLARTGVLAAASVAGSTLLTTSTAAASRQQTRTTLQFLVGFPINGLTQEVFTQALDPFLRAHRSLSVQLVQPSVMYVGNTGIVAEAILAGTAPDVFESWRFNDIAATGYLMDLTPFVKSSNLNLNLFPASLVRFFTRNGRLYGLPEANEWTALAINLTLLDQLGLRRPPQDWDVYTARELYAQMAKPSSNPAEARYGSWFWMYYSNEPSQYYLSPWGASAVNPNDPAQSAIASPEMVQAITFMADLIHAGVCGWSTGLGWNHFVRQKVGVGIATDFTLPNIAEAAATAGFDFDFWPNPAGPKGGATWGSSSYYAMPVTVKDANAAWSLLEYIETTPYLARAIMRLYLYPSPFVNLQDEFIATIQQYAPALRHKNLSAFSYWSDHAEQPAFAYDPAQAQAIASNYFGAIWDNKMSVVAALTEANRQLNALETAAAAAAAATARGAAQLQALAHASGPVALAAPAVAGAGVPAAKNPALASSSPTTGTWDLLGDGSGLSGTSDNCAFVCTTDTSSEAEYRCRLTWFGNLNCPSLSPWAMAGLMARGDLSDDAPMVAIALTGGNGVALSLRVLAPTRVNQTTGGSPGLLASSALMASTAKGSANQLLRPLYLKLRRQGTTWTAYTSLDGSRWLQAGDPVIVEALGMWVGLFATADNGATVGSVAFGNKGYVRAAFDRLSFQPAAVYQIGQSGIPPAAGPIPATWVPAAAGGQ
jgi:ABC-type glycerol-3-phosphate transport system substrate-binding protein